MLKVGMKVEVLYLDMIDMACSKAKEGSTGVIMDITQGKFSGNTMYTVMLDGYYEEFFIGAEKQLRIIKEEK